MTTRFPLLAQLNLLLALLLLVSNVVANNFTSRTSVGLGFLYTFQEGQTNASAQLTSSGVPGMGPIFLGPGTWNPARQGLRFTDQAQVTTMYSAGVSQLKMGESSFWSEWTKLPNDTAFTLEMWVKFDSSAVISRNAIIAAFADLYNWTGYTPGVACGSQYGHPMFLQTRQITVSNHIGFSVYFTGEGGQRDCDPSLRDPFSDEQPDYVAPLATQVTLRKALSATPGVHTYTLRIRSSEGVLTFVYHTDPNEFIAPGDWRNARLHLALGFQTDRLYPGMLFMIGLYTRNLTDEEVEGNFWAGLPNSIPYNPPLDTVHGFQEVPLTISLPMTDVDGDPLNFTILSLPSKGKLYAGPTNSSTPITTADLPLRLPNHSRYVTFVGEFMQYGERYTSFSYQAREETGGTSPVVTLTVNLTRVNKPPFADSSTQYLRSGGYAVIAFNGSDIDNSPGPLTPRLTYVGAKLGTVFQYPTGQNFPACAPSCLQGLTMSANDFVSDPLRRVAVLTNPQCSPESSGQRVVGTDTIRFRMYDSEGSGTPADATVTCLILNHLEAVSGSQLGLSDTPGLYTLNVLDYSHQPPLADNSNSVTYIDGLPLHGTASIPGAGEGGSGGANLTLTPPLYILTDHLFSYQTYIFWSGNDTLNFTAVSTTASPCGIGWKSASSVFTLNVGPVIYKPLLRFVGDTTQLVTLDFNEPWPYTLEFIQHSEPYMSADDLYMLRCDSDSAHSEDVSFGFDPSAVALVQTISGGSADRGFLEATDGNLDYNAVVLAPLNYLRALFSESGNAHPPTLIANTGWGSLSLTCVLCFASDVNMGSGIDFQSGSNHCPNDASSFTLSVTLMDPGGVAQASALPLPGLIFAWIGIAFIAVSCYGCLAWRWWKNKKLLQQRVRTNMRDSATAVTVQYLGTL